MPREKTAEIAGGTGDKDGHSGHTLMFGFCGSNLIRIRSPLFHAFALSAAMYSLVPS